MIKITYFKFHFNYIIFCFFVFWIFEWLLFFDYILGHWTTNNFIFLFRTPVLLVLIFIFWLYVWGFSAWRRAIFGKFTRGEKQLWYKSLVSFWITELITLFGFVMAGAWMSWGPKIFMPRYFWIPKKGFLLEIIIFSYIIWLIYLLRFSIKFYLWKTQIIFLLCILFFSSYLIWRDFLTLWTRELLTQKYGSHWKFIQLISVIYSLENSYWFNHLLGTKGFLNHQLHPLKKILNSKASLTEISPFSYILYEEFRWSPHYDKIARLNLLVPWCTFFIHHYHFFSFLEVFKKTIFFSSDPNYLLDTHKFFTRKLGFIPKKMAMWYFFIVLKMWHHLMLFIWWFFLLHKLITFKKTSYNFLLKCHFNVYCCFLLSWVVCLFQYFPNFELFFKNHPKKCFSDSFKIHFYWAFYYLKSLIFSYSSSQLNIFFETSQVFIFQSKHFFKFLVFSDYNIADLIDFPKQIKKRIWIHDLSNSIR